MTNYGYAKRKRKNQEVRRLYSLYSVPPNCRVGQCRTQYIFRQEFQCTWDVLYNNFCNWICRHTSNFNCFNMYVATFVPLTASWSALGNYFAHLHFSNICAPNILWKSPQLCSLVLGRKKKYLWFRFHIVKKLGRKYNFFWIFFSWFWQFFAGWFSVESRHQY